MTEKNKITFTWRSKLFTLLICKAALLFALIASGVIPLAPDEAQYWTWSQALDWGYYSKPPGIAWQIAATTSLFGNNEFGVRFGAVLFGFLLALVLYKWSERLGLTQKQAFWGAIAFAFSPLGFYLSFAATTDPGAIFFFTLGAMVCPNYILAGSFVFFGALFKWTAFALWPLVLFTLFFVPQMRKKSLIVGILISLLALLPSFYWNLSHDFATFKHVAGSAKKWGGNFFDFFASQILLLSPIFFLLFVCAFVKIVREKRRDFYFLAFLPGEAVFFYIFASLFSKMQPNWAAYLYPPAFILMAWFSIEKYRKWIQAGLILSIFLVVALFSARFLPLPYKMNPFKQNLGWDRLAKTLSQTGYDPSQHFLFADKYQVTSVLSFYVKPQAYFFNLEGRRKNQFSYMEQMSPSQIGRTGYFVVAEESNGDEWFRSHYSKLLESYFEKVEYCGSYQLFPGKSAYIFRATKYNGTSPEQLEKY